MGVGRMKSFARRTTQEITWSNYEDIIYFTLHNCLRWINNVKESSSRVSLRIYTVLEFFALFLSRFCNVQQIQIDNFILIIIVELIECFSMIVLIAIFLLAFLKYKWPIFNLIKCYLFSIFYWKFQTLFCAITCCKFYNKESPISRYLS